MSDDEQDERIKLLETEVLVIRVTQRRHSELLQAIQEEAQEAYQANRTKLEAIWLALQEIQRDLQVRQ